MIRAALVLAALLSTAAPAFAQAQDATVTLTFDIAADTGAIMVGLYDQSTYASGPPIRGARIDVAAGQRTATFEGLPAGDYGVKAFHDVDGDGVMDTNPFGIPTEPFAFSNNAVGNMGPASWDRARFAVSGTTAQTIRLR